MAKLTRRGVLVLGALSMPLAACSGAPAITEAHANTLEEQNRNGGVSIEKKSLEQLYQDALAEGGQLVVYAGGDASDQNDWIAQAFKQQFPRMNIVLKTDLSKYHDARIDNQLARNQLEPDVAHLQTLQDFDRWKSEGQLLAYKPVGWDQVYPQFKDPDGAYVGIMTVAFSYQSNNRLVPASQAPRTALDFLGPEYKGKLINVWPNDDDAVLYMFKNIIDKYGWTYMDSLMAQQPMFVRGGPNAIGPVIGGRAAATITGYNSLVSDPTSSTTFTIPTGDFFQSWAQTAAIFKKARHPAAAKLYLNWLLSRPFQQNLPQWSVRQDVPPPRGYKPLLAYKNTNPVGFHNWMKDRAAVEQFRFQIELYVGAPQGPNPAGARGPLLLTTS